ncbi:MAG: hypothetical protein ACOY0R_05600 [Chloroflexota bacterium]
MNTKIVFRILAALVLVAAVVGIAGFAFRAGMMRGATLDWQPPAALQDGQAPALPYGHGMPYGMPHHHPFGFGLGCFGLLIPLLLFFLAAKAFRFMVFGPRWGHPMHGGHGPWGRGGCGEGGVPPMFNEWHKRAHNVPAGGGETSEAPADDKKE